MVLRRTVFLGAPEEMARESPRRVKRIVVPVS